MVVHPIDLADADRIIGPIERFAKQEGLQPYSVIERSVGPTDDAHEFLAFVTAKSLHREAWKKVFRAHFGEGRTFWTIEALTDFTPALGLDATEAHAALTSGEYKQSVKNDQRDAHRLGANGIPFIVLDSKYCSPVRGTRMRC